MAMVWASIFRQINRGAIFLGGRFWSNMKGITVVKIIYQQKILQLVICLVDPEPSDESILHYQDGPTC